MEVEMNACAENGGGVAVQRGVRRWVWERILTLYRRHLYRHVMRAAHRYNWHYAPPQGLMHGEKPDGQKRHWCQWCGLRGNTLDYEHFKGPLSPNAPDQGRRASDSKTL